MKFFVFLALLLVSTMGIVGCQFFENAPVTVAQSKSCDSLLRLVNSDHDVAMAKMGDLMKYEARAHEEIKQINGSNPTRKETLTKTIEVLSAAQNAMMDWMNNYAEPAKNENADRVIKYLTEQHGKVLTVKSSILGTLKQAEITFDESPEQVAATQIDSLASN